MSHPLGTINLKLLESVHIFLSYEFSAKKTSKSWYFFHKFQFVFWNFCIISSSNFFLKVFSQLATQFRLWPKSISEQWTAKTCQNYREAIKHFSEKFLVKASTHLQNSFEYSRISRDEIKQIWMLENVQANVAGNYHFLFPRFYRLSMHFSSTLVWRRE